MKYDPAIYHRKSIRLKGYNYSQAVYYFSPFVAIDDSVYLAKLLMMGCN